MVGEAGDASPSTSIGVNLPNANWIRAAVVSKSMPLGNIINASNNAGRTGRLNAFENDDAELENQREYCELANKLETSLHEVNGRASGQLTLVLEKLRKHLKTTPQHYRKVEQI